MKGQQWQESSGDLHFLCQHPERLVHSQTQHSIIHAWKMKNRAHYDIKTQHLKSLTLQSATESMYLAVLGWRSFFSQGNFSFPAAAEICAPALWGTDFWLWLLTLKAEHLPACSGQQIPSPSKHILIYIVAIQTAIWSAVSWERGVYTYIYKMYIYIMCIYIFIASKSML